MLCQFFVVSLFVSLCNGISFGPHCADLTKDCFVNGDPHYNTFDNVQHHFQGAGYYDVVTQCCDWSGWTLPFRVSTRQTSCGFGVTCVVETIVTINPGTPDERIISFPFDGSTPVYKDPPTGSAVGNHVFGNVEFAVSSTELMVYVDGVQIFYMHYVGYSLTLRASKCLKDVLCGLCGKLSHDAGVDDYTRCDNCNLDPSLNDWGLSCCNDQLVNDFGGSALPSCSVSGFPPAPDCLDQAEDICEEAKEKCRHSFACRISDDQLVEDCKIDVCAAAGGDLGTCTTHKCAEANGWLDVPQDTCDNGCGGPGGRDDPHFTTFDGHRFNFQDHTHDLEQYAFDYMKPCNETDLVKRMPIMIRGKHFMLDDDKDLSGVEYVVFQLFDYDNNKMYVVWVSSNIHHWMILDLKQDQIDVDSMVDLMYHKHNATAKTLESGVRNEFGTKFEFLFVQISKLKAQVNLKIDNKCHVDMSIYFQKHVKFVNVDVNGRHGMHRFDIHTSCYKCYTCGLLGSNLCESETFGDAIGEK